MSRAGERLRRLTSCTGKARFDSHALASKARQRTPHGGKAARNVYHCRYCDGFHVGNSKPRVRRPGADE